MGANSRLGAYSNKYGILQGTELQIKMCGGHRVHLKSKNANAGKFAID